MADSRNGRPKAGPEQEEDHARLTRRDWIEKGLDLLTEGGGEGLKIRRVADELGVTYGSFYHHFSSADEFYRAMLKYWRKDLLGCISHEHLRKPDPTFASLMKTLAEHGLPEYDFAIRKWAKTYEPAASEIKKADAFRMRMATRFLQKRGLNAETAKARGEMLISMRIGVLEHPDQSRRDETFRRFVEIADNVG